METTQSVLLAACEAAEKIDEIIKSRGLAGHESAVLEALKAAYDNSRRNGLVIN
ncbi:hypothetical protein NUF46_003937 [Yersinia enterocolitica]|uniref:hypothetical protein n=1 Tax=Yersinia enterocolitica TaxID=630 RepID=UPI0022FE7522|nr:hypothetical protein [Yersinia enterocolitica]EKN3942133.1 hypothetical protein [Yersinia enterocolitica]EKN3952936.1 hypothetical protein [Yersinia enterocolitica]EKN4037614.1 hypothetical protein [Yersinia enterocolitica]ELI8151045.1 hypothetical protein [Yersinia enterocolitica]MDA5533180.1 hypothetical protein [Yersinia enterocolitica]